MPPPSSKPASRASPKAARLASEPSHMAKVDKDRLRPSVSTRTLQFSIIAEETVVTRTYLLHPKAELASLGPSKTSSKAHPTSAKPSTPHTSPSRLGGGVTAASYPPVRTPRTKPYHQSTPSTPHRKVVHPAPASRPATLGSQTSRIVSSPNLTRSPARADGRKEVPKRLGPSPPQRDGSRSSPPALRARSPAAGRASTLNSSHAPPRRSAHTSRSWSVSPPPKSLRSIPSTSSTIPLSPPSLPSLPSLSSLPSLPSPPHPPHQLRAPSPLDVPQPEPHLSPSSIPPEAVPPALTFKVENPSPAAVESPSHPSASDVPFKFKEQFEVFVGHILDSQKLIQDASLEEGECLLAAVLSFSRHLNIPRRPQGPFPCPHGDKTIMFTWKLLGSRDGDPHNDIDTEFSRPKAILDVLVGDVRKHMSSMLASQDAGVLATTPDQRSAAEARKVLDTIYIHGVWSPNANWTEDPARDDHDRLQNGTKGTHMGRRFRGNVLPVY
ncbi:hypothetical protein OF83DRAFT_797542 [Amylostereum chailletii]|nr:hypothetical protein OF83DRAFT_797542 [Amylostereum chailletii]